ncbi:amino acid deaminase/aldolase [Nakamurella silvestris]|nr:amino acid deaminase/aldolase [Nakamurella silvestris]
MDSTAELTSGGTQAPQVFDLTTTLPVPAGFGAIERATAGLDAPLVVVDLAAMALNAADLLRRAAGKPVRIASKSLRCRSLIESALALPGFRGVLAYTLAEALWLADRIDDVVVGYPTADASSLRRLAADERLAARVTLMVDSVEQLEYLDRVLGTGGPQIRICLDLDASLEYFGGAVHLGARRSPLHGRSQAVALARAVDARPRLHLVGMMSYEAQIAGVGDNAPGSAFGRAQIRLMQRFSAAELRGRRAAVVAAVRQVADLEFVNGGGSGSVAETAAEDCITEIAAGSGLYAPVLFDRYRSFQPVPAVYFGLAVTRRPTGGMVTVHGGGWIASGPAGADRSPTPVWPEGLRMTGLEGAGEVQTPLAGKAADGLAVGDRVWFRHAKAGEICEHRNTVHVIDGDRLIGEVPTYRGEGQAFL